MPAGGRFAIRTTGTIIVRENRPGTARRTNGSQAEWAAISLQILDENAAVSAHAA
jgi:hypothetical protein